ncbi:ABC transporter transmembrane domain-containing protein [Arhodomonas sp. AD133]|uniref:ABC transporter transmembrane domain-containing protein n=1 Tax=Arhodomonas sp. AD133 TaxID=3415009 RepID=UPI003EBDD23B
MREPRRLQRTAHARVRSLRLLLRLLRPHRGRLLAAALALLVAAGSVLAVGQGLRYVIDGGFMAGNAAMLDRGLTALLAIVAVMALATAVRFYLVSWIGERATAALRKEVFDHLLCLEPAFFELNGAGEIQSRLTADTAVIQTILGSSFSLAVRNVLLALGAVTMLFVTSPALTGLVVMGMPLVLAPLLIHGRRVRRLSRHSQDRIAELGGFASETLHAIRTVQAFNHEAEDRRRFGEHVEAAFAAARQRIQQRAWLTGMIMGLVFTAVAAVLWRGGHQVLAGSLSAGELSAFVFYAVLAAGAVATLSEVAGEVYRAAGAAERLQELLDAPPSIAAPADPVTLPNASGAIALEGVHFAYPSRRETPALVDIDLAVHPGERIALVGPSGAGKSTLFALLLRFYDPDAGSVRIDGVDLRHADPAAIRARLALVAQEPTLFTGSVRGNIAYGDPHADETAIRAAAGAADCLEFIDRLPQGLETPVGPGGVRLSGGQRQRLAIARAVLRDPAILLLDEATSHLDSESERRVQIALERLMARRTSVVIAHRLATVTAADRIVVLEHGRIRAEGTHAALLRESRLYARLASRQLA